MPDFMDGKGDLVIIITYLVGQAISLYKDHRNHKWAKDKEAESSAAREEIKTLVKETKAVSEETKVVSIDALNARSEVDKRIEDLSRQFLDVKKEGAALIVTTDNKLRKANARRKRTRRARISRKLTS